MNKRALKIKNIIDYLIQVSNNETIKDKKQNFFLSIPQLDKILREYFIYFDNKDLSNQALHYNYNLIKDLSFSKEGKSFLMVKDLSVTNTVHYTNEEHNSYSNYIHSHLIKVFEDKLEINGFKSKSEKSNNPYPLLFVSGEVYNKFIEYNKTNHIIDFYIDYSYLKKRLEYEKLIHRTKDNEFMEIIYKMKFISEKDYNKYTIKNKLLSLNKSSSASRENNFNNIFLD
tara:strand:+ start:693 stop:1376 length:684 start_codon:yes stop_codon:yes gene_type:complete